MLCFLKMNTGYKMNRGKKKKKKKKKKTPYICGNL